MAELFLGKKKEDLKKDEKSGNDNKTPVIIQPKINTTVAPVATRVYTPRQPKNDSIVTDKLNEILILLKKDNKSVNDIIDELKNTYELNDIDNSKILKYKKQMIKNKNDWVFLRFLIRNKRYLETFASLIKE